MNSVQHEDFDNNFAVLKMNSMKHESFDNNFAEYCEFDEECRQRREQFEEG